MADQLTLKNTTLAKAGGVPAATDVVTTNGLVFINPKVKSGDYEDVGTGAMGSKKTYIDPDYIVSEFDIPVQMKKAPALGVAPTLSNLFKIAGLSETITASTKVEYKPGGTGAGTGQFKVYVDGHVRTVTGATANLKISGKVGEPLSATFSCKGFLDAAEAIAEANPAVTLDTAMAPIVSSVTVFTVGGGSIQADSFEFDLGNDIGETYAVGKKEYYLKDFDPSINVTAVKVKGTDEAAWTDYSAGTVRAIIIQVGTAGAMEELMIPYAMLKDVGEADDNGKVKINRTFRAQASVGNDNFTYTYK